MLFTESDAEEDRAAVVKATVLAVETVKAAAEVAEEDSEIGSLFPCGRCANLAFLRGKVKQSHVKNAKDKIRKG
jgi:hypothetical protein